MPKHHFWSRVFVFVLTRLPLLVVDMATVKLLKLRSELSQTSRFSPYFVFLEISFIKGQIESLTYQSCFISIFYCKVFHPDLIFLDRIINLSDSMNVLHSLTHIIQFLYLYSLGRICLSGRFSIRNYLLGEFLIYWRSINFRSLNVEQALWRG